MGNVVVLPSKIKSKFPKRLPKLSKFSKSSKTSKTSEGGSSRKKDEPLKYYLANFEKDTDIMVILHFLGCYLFQSIFSAPVEEKMATQGDYQVLDVGCGAGTWMLDLATIYKTPMFTGIDICTMFPAEIKPDNVVFMQGDILNGLPYDDNSFDYVHQGNMVCVFTTQEWDFILSELIRVCKPGGYIEFTEPELATNTGPILTRFYDALLDHSNSRNVKIRISNDIISSLESLESLSMIQNVEYKTTTVSLGYTKGGNAGQAYFEVHDGFFLNEPMPETLCTFMGLSKDEYLDLFDEAKKEVNTGIAPDCDLYRIWCQKV